MSDFVEQTRTRFEQMFNGHHAKLTETSARWEDETRRLTHHVVELVCMDGRISPIMPYGLAPIIPIAGGVPQTQNKPYQDWLKRNLKRAQKSKVGLIQLVQLHTECAAFDRNLEVAMRAATSFDQETHNVYDDTVHNFILLYNVIHGGVSILEPKQQRWFELASLDRNHEPNLDSGFFKAGSITTQFPELTSDLARIAYLSRHTRQSAGNVVQRHRELAIVAGDITVPWRGNGEFLSYRMDAVDDKGHAMQLNRAAAVVRGSLNSSGKSREPLCIFVVRRAEVPREDGHSSLESIQKLVRTVIPHEQVVFLPYCVYDNARLVAE